MLTRYTLGTYMGMISGSWDTKNPPLTNSVVIFPYGWNAIRFVADNPGIWAFHCHIEPHLHMGMGLVFSEGVELAHQKDIKQGSWLWFDREDVDELPPHMRLDLFSYAFCFIFDA
ncbi:hypothetical protein HHK36_011629 [Tetracentron sinense]|uniref:Plastocyanin-like domain-containing protein n=1 Tax=Tetracentron sinense TaxID=13715 RepID=A0A834ZD76_TETSI|nr:hypothetical protein HHK36_011629 [Tetracentron sinense]